MKEDAVETIVSEPASKDLMYKEWVKGHLKKKTEESPVWSYIREDWARVSVALDT